jgi:hypothetical protein
VRQLSRGESKLMPASKRVVIGVGVAGSAALLLLLAVLLYLYVPRKKRGDAPGVECGAAPVVSADTGAVTNFKNLPMPDGTCGENVATLSALCLATRCTSPSLCPGYATWDAYDSKTHTCVKVATPTCEQQLCDAPYCTSASVRAVLPPMHKLSRGTGQCVNPGEVEVAAACNALDGYQYVSPDCRQVNMVKCITLIEVPGVQNSTTLVQGILTLPAAPPTQPWVFGYTLTGVSGTFTGSLSTSVATDSTLCVKQQDDDECMSFAIHFLPGAVKPGNYTLDVLARPQWSRVFTCQSTSTMQVTLRASTDPNVNAALNIVPSRDEAVSVLQSQDGAQLRQLLTAMLSDAAARSVGVKVPPDLTFNKLFNVDLPNSAGAGLKDALYVCACDPSICPVEGAPGKLMPFAIVCVAWPPVPALADAQCKSAAVQYEVRKDSDRTGATLLTPGLPTAFTDLVRVGETVKYTITTTQGTCKSEPVVLTFLVPPFSDSVCQQVPAPEPGLPPWMWASNAGCVWNPNQRGAQDFYCAFQYNNSDNTLDATSLILADKNNRCRRVLPSYPTLQSGYEQPACNLLTRKKEVCFTGYTGEPPRTAVCSPALQLQNTGDTIDGPGAFTERLNSLVTFFNLHNTNREASAADIETTAKQLELYADAYYKCGPETHAKSWGVEAAQCTGEDVACRDAVSNGACSANANDRNVCFPWVPACGQYTDKASCLQHVCAWDASSSKCLPQVGQPSVFNQQRICFGDAGFTDKQCCAADEQYNFKPTDPRDLLGATRGTCTPVGKA